MKKSRIIKEKQEKLTDYFISGATARTAAELANVNRNTAIYYFHQLRELIFELSRERKHNVLVRNKN